MPTSLDTTRLCLRPRNNGRSPAYLYDDPTVPIGANAMITRFKTFWMSLGAAAGLSLMAVAAMTVDAPSRPAGDFGKVSEEMAAAATGLWKALAPEQQAKAKFEFKDEE